MIPAWSDDAILHELFDADRRVGALPPDAEVIARPGWWQLRTPSFRRGGFNEVALSVLTDEEADAVIDETIDGYRRRGLRFRWRLGPGSAPADLGERLAARGLQRTITWAMARGTDRLEDFRADAPAIRVERVDAGNVDVFTEVNGRGWSMDPAPLRASNRRIVASGCPTGLFLATWEGAPAAASAVEFRDRSAFLIGGVVLPEFRGRGLYRALLRARLQAAADLGLTLAVTHAIVETSGPILSSLGFVTVLPFEVFLFDPEAEGLPSRSG
ncbi:MAG: GNAT family N-acetyltransferase [Nannocystaceae bacterium]